MVPVAPVQIRSTIRRPWPLVPVALSVIALGVAVAVAVGVAVAVAVAVAVGVALGATVAVAVAVAVAVGVAVGDAALVDCLSWKASCWELPLIATRPSTHARRCWFGEELP